MFNTATNFNQDISSWDVSNLTEMDRMFSGASAFNQDLSGWDVSSITNIYRCRDMSLGATSWNDDDKPGQTSGHPCYGE